MNKNYVKYIFLTAALSFTLTGCGNASSGENTLKSDCYEAYKELDAGNWDKAISLFSSKTQGNQPEYMVLLGLAKAQIGSGDWSAAKDTLLKATSLYPEEITAFIYQGEAAKQLEDYDLAAESYYQAVKLDLEVAENEKEYVRNVQIRDLFSENLDQMQDIQKGYEYAKELYQSEKSDDTILESFLWAAAKADTEETKAGVKEAVAGQPQEYAVMTLIQACDELKAGNKEEAEKLLFDAKHADDWKDAGNLRFGYNSGKNGEMMVVGVQSVFGTRGLMFGTYSDGNWNGECEAWHGRCSDTTMTLNDVEYKGKYYINYQFSGNWSQGIPEGTILYNSDHHSEYEERAFDQYYYTDEGVMDFSGGKAQGRIEIKGYSSRNGEAPRLNDITVHEFKDGKPQPFSADTKDGTKMVYEFTYSTGSSWSRYEDQDCGDSYIWEE